MIFAHFSKRIPCPFTQKKEKKTFGTFETNEESVSYKVELEKYRIKQVESVPAQHTHRAREKSQNYC